MLERLQPFEFIGEAKNGRTKPLHLVCKNANSDAVEVIAKYSANCDEGVINLAREVIAACLAADLNLPVARPYLVEFSKEFMQIIPPSISGKLKCGSTMAFGSSFVTGQFSTWHSSYKISDEFQSLAFAIFVFDAIIQNPDRRDGNSNCLVRGDDCLIFDHELCFMVQQILSWRPPWEMGSLSSLKIKGNHIFVAGLSGKDYALSEVRAQWSAISDYRLAEYEKAIPPEWSAASAAVRSALKLIRDARENIDGCLQEIKRVLE